MYIYIYRERERERCNVYIYIYIHNMCVYLYICIYRCAPDSPTTGARCRPRPNPPGGRATSDRRWRRPVCEDYTILYYTILYYTILY